ncbi:MAG: hypothetical protein IT462_06075 [Planctomycetes bacterium]|nr:hypothetical protein [Planctomycetota bacterium]
MKRAVMFVCVVAAMLAASAPGRAQSAAEMAPRSRDALKAREIADAILAREYALLDMARCALAKADSKTCTDLGAEIVGCGVREAQLILDKLVGSDNPNVLLAATVALDSEIEDVRLAALDVLLDAPFEWLGKAGDEALTPARRMRLLEMLSSAGELARRADGIAGSARNAYNVHVNIQIGLIADRYFGAPGYLKVLRGLAEVMLGDAPKDPAGEPDLPPKPEKPKEGEKPASPAETPKRDVARERAVADHRRRSGAAALFRELWIEDLTLFNYLPEAKYALRQAAVGRIRARLDEMEKQNLALGEISFTGVRCGDYLIQLFDSDNNEVKAAAYLRLVLVSGMTVAELKTEAVPLAGEGYTEVVANLLALSRRKFGELRRDLKAWWATYRKATEPK